MGTVTVSFLGACTIFRDLSSLPAADPLPSGTAIPSNRVVLARTTVEFIAATHVDPHLATLQLIADEMVVDGPLPPLDPIDPHTYFLDGHGLRIVNASNTTLGPQGGVDCLPRLQVFLNAPLGPPARWVYVPDRENAQAWFDFEGGDLRAYLMNTDPPCDKVPSISILTIETDGAPILEIKRWDEAGPTRVTLTRQSEPPNVIVSNFAFGSGIVDDDRDFLLNYRTAATFPPLEAIDIPHANACTIASPIVYHLSRCGDAGPGCSNTNYP